MSDEALATLETDCGDSLNAETFGQILEMDDDEDDREFSRNIVFDFLRQVETTFEQLDNQLAAKDLPELSSLGHFLKGSSATLGLDLMRNSCEKIQNYGRNKTGEEGQLDEPDNEICLKAIKAEVAKLKEELVKVKAAFEKFFRGSTGKGEE
ncbi:MAG: hypothetical protein M1828_001787 [Chrysothrix sp. TS-e1954]|nr:MAG: hypothetical protein M1828_001787 [Chrysothrix sp. TS-e1954]